MFDNLRAKFNSNPKLKKQTRLALIGAAAFFGLYLISSAFTDNSPKKVNRHTVNTNVIGGQQDVSDNLKVEGLVQRVIELEKERAQGDVFWRRKIGEIEAQKSENDSEITKLRDEFRKVQLDAREEIENRLGILYEQIKTNAGQVDTSAGMSLEKPDPSILGPLLDNSKAIGAYDEDDSPNSSSMYKRLMDESRADDNPYANNYGENEPTSSGTDLVRSVNDDQSTAPVKSITIRKIAAEKKTENLKNTNGRELENSETVTEVAKVARPKQIVPAGSIIPGLLIQGVDAPTGNSASANPHPVLIRVKKEALLPNLYRADFKECLIIGSAHGNLSTSRAEIRTETLSCIREDGGVIEKKLKGYLNGEDGKVGLAGEIVTRQGALIARSILAGFMSGISDAFSPQEVPVIADSTNGTTVYNRRSVDDILTVSAFNGVSTAADKVADFYLKFAENIFPVIEIKPGRKIDIVLSAGLVITL